MKYTEEEYKNEVKLVHGDKFEVISNFKGLTKPILLQSKYGILSVKTAAQVLNNEPSILLALNKTEYFMNQFKEKYPEESENIAPASEYVNARTKMLFNTKFGIVSTTPDTLIAGHMPTIRSAINRKEYFYNQLKYLYQDFDYDFKVESTNRHEGRVTLICPIHGESKIDSDWIFSGCGCPKCNNGWNKSTSFYIIKMSSEKETFYKLGITYRLKDGSLRRYKDYKTLGYNIEELFSKDFEDFTACIDLETKLKRLIKDFLYTPKNWSYKTSTECFKDNLLEIILQNVKLHMI